MKRSAVPVLILAFLALLAVIVWLGVGYRKTTERYTQTREAEETLRGQFNTALESIAEIQEGLNEIVPAEERLVRLSQDAEMGSTIAPSQKERIFNTIEDLRQSIEGSKRKIRELEESLRNSQAEVTGLRRLIDNLKSAVAERELVIARLSARVDSLSVTVVGLQAEVARGQERISEQQGVIAQTRLELGTVFYIVGTKQELKDKGIIAETGGVLGLRKSLQLTGNFRESDFTRLDTDARVEIPIRGREPRVLSAQSRESYDLRGGAEQSVLRITDPSEFRRVKYLVVMIKER